MKRFRYTSLDADPPPVAIIPMTTTSRQLRPRSGCTRTQVVTETVVVVACSGGGCGLTFHLIYNNSDPARIDLFKEEEVPERGRDQSDTAGVSIPEIDLELGSGTLGGQVTTVEGLITKISESLERVHGFTFGDSIDDNRRSKWQDFRARLTKTLEVGKPVALATFWRVPSSNAA
ncbi:hypothetical protein RJ639_028475 [Escallonia herrerae]|uniref:Zinc finger ZPR1-type domain-containing protein n=1 Tax=Escallonia herrerae TaxID=1293975 RepID=A0AA88XF20_9ASTE|nr:hypothetical protein RJ639_028475 [Escallonia herrerae]